MVVHYHTWCGQSDAQPQTNVGLEINQLGTTLQSGLKLEPEREMKCFAEILMTAGVEPGPYESG